MLGQILSELRIDLGEFATLKELITLLSRATAAKFVLSDIS